MLASVGGVHRSSRALWHTTIPSGGRYELGIGWGSQPGEFEVFGVGSTQPRRRVQRLRGLLTRRENPGRVPGDDRTRGPHTHVPPAKMKVAPRARPGMSFARLAV